MKKALKILGIILAIIVLAIIAYLFYIKHRIDSGELVKWEGEWYTLDEIEKKYGPQVYDVPSKNNPEDVYAQFRQYLLEDNIEGALGLMREERRVEYREAFKNKERFEWWLTTLPEYIDNGRFMGNFAYYDWDKNDGYKHTIDFTKNQNGYWEIDSI